MQFNNANILGQQNTAPAAQQDVRGQPHHSAKIPSNMSWSAKKAQSHAKIHSYIKVGSGNTTSNRMISGAKKTWGVDPIEDRNKAKGLDIAYIDSIFISPSTGGNQKQYLLRVSSDIINLITFLQYYQFAANDVEAITIIVRFAMTSPVMHGNLNEAPMAGVQLAADRIKPGFQARYQKLIDIYGNQEVINILRTETNGVTYIQQLRKLFYQQEAAREQFRRDQKARNQAPDNMKLFIFMSKMLSKALVKDSNGNIITNIRSCGGRRSGASIREAYDAVGETRNPGQDHKILNISSYLEPDFKFSKLALPKTNKTGMVPVPFADSNKNDYIWTSTHESVSNALKEIFGDKLDSNQIANAVTTVRARLAEKAQNTKKKTANKRGAKVDVPGSISGLQSQMANVTVSKGDMSNLNGTSLGLPEDVGDNPLTGIGQGIGSPEERSDTLGQVPFELQ